MEAKEVIEQIQKNAETHKAETIHIATMKIGEIVRQGDIYVEKVQAMEPYDGFVETAERQLAPGTSKGSRHKVSRETECEIFVPPSSTGTNPLIGPHILAKSRLVIEHPEHGWLDLPPGYYAVTYQREFDPKELRRVMD